MAFSELHIIGQSALRKSSIKKYVSHRAQHKPSHLRACSHLVPVGPGAVLLLLPEMQLSRKVKALCQTAVKHVPCCICGTKQQENWKSRCARRDKRHPEQSGVVQRQGIWTHTPHTEQHRNTQGFSCSSSTATVYKYCRID